MAMATVKMTKSKFRQVYGKRGYRPQSVLKKPLGQIKLGKNRAEGQGVPFNLFPQIADRLPGILGDIVVETTVAVAAGADSKVPVGKTGALKKSQAITYFHSRENGAIVTGRVAYDPEDPPGSGHFYGFYVEVGGARGAAQPFLIPALIAERSEFNQKLRNIEDRL